MNEKLLNYACLDEFKDQYFKELLGAEHVISEEVNIPKVMQEDGQSHDTFNFWGYVLSKGGVKYLLASRDKSGKEIHLKSVLPIKPVTTTKVSSKGVVYREIKKPVSMKFRAEKAMSFRELVDTLCCFSHSNKKHQYLAMLIGLTSLFDRIYFRLATPPGFGKDSIVDTLNAFLGGAGTIENPSIAKLEERANVLKWLVVNEAIDIARSDWLLIEHFLLSAGAFKNTVTKRTRGFGGVGETIDISDFSLSLMYNDINCYPNMSKYLDFVSKSAVLDRFPPIRLYGRITHDFNDIKNTNISEFVAQHKDVFVSIMRSLLYYKELSKSFTNPYNNVSRENVLTERWQISFGRIANVVAMYAERQEEYDDMCNALYDAVEDYQEMLHYPKHLKRYKDYLDTRRQKMVQENIAPEEIERVIQKELSLCLQEVDEALLFEQKNAVFDRHMTSQQKKQISISDYDSVIL